MSLPHPASTHAPIMEHNDTNLDWLKRAGTIDRLREATHNLDAMLGAMKALQEGGPLRRGLAALAITAHLAEALLPDTDPEALLEQQGWKAVSKHSDVDTLLLRLLRMRPCRRISLPQRSGRNNARSTLEIWELQGQPAVAAIKGWESWEVLERRPGATAELLADMWDDHKVWVVGRQGMRGELNLNPVASKAEQPIGEQAAAMREWVREKSDGTRIALIVGPTGAGKTSLARTALGNQRVLQMPCAAVNTDALVELAAVLQPGVVLLDDIVLNRSGLDQELAGMMDRLHGRVELVIATFMDDELTREQAWRPGGLYWPGMRAGRIDRVVFLSPPDLEERRKILEHYGVEGDVLGALAGLSQGLTGAFLRQLALLSVGRAVTEIPAIVRQLRAQAPAAFSVHLEKKDAEEAS